MSDIFFSIIIPTYNRAQQVARVLDSALRQEEKDFELWVIDDGSTDNTEEIVKQFRDDRIHYHRKENAERGAARNTGSKLSKGKYINFFDSDDIMYPNHLSTAKAVIEKSKEEVAFFHLGYDFQTEEGLVTKSVNDLTTDSIDRILFNNILSCNGVFLKRDLVEKFRFEEDRRLASSEDWELWLRLIARFELYLYNDITTAVIGHSMRSISTIPSRKIIERDLLLIDMLKRDPEVMKLYGKRFSKFIADRYTYFMLNLAVEGKTKEVIRWAGKAVGIYPQILFDRRFLASITKSIRP